MKSMDTMGLRKFYLGVMSNILYEMNIVETMSFILSYSVSTNKILWYIPHFKFFIILSN